MWVSRAICKSESMSTKINLPIALPQNAILTNLAITKCAIVWRARLLKKQLKGFEIKILKYNAIFHNKLLSI